MNQSLQSHQASIQAYLTAHSQSDRCVFDIYSEVCKLSMPYTLASYTSLVCHKCINTHIYTNAIHFTTHYTYSYLCTILTHTPLQIDASYSSLQAIQPYTTCSSSSTTYTNTVNNLCGDGINGVFTLYIVYIITAGK